MAETTCSSLAMQSSHGTRLAFHAEASIAPCSPNPWFRAQRYDAVDSMLQQRSLRGTWARKNPRKDMRRMPISLHDVGRVPSSCTTHAKTLRTCFVSMGGWGEDVNHSTQMAAAVRVGVHRGHAHAQPTSRMILCFLAIAQCCCAPSRSLSQGI